MRPRRAEIRAVRQLQCFWRTVYSRKRLRVLARSVFQLVRDEATGSFYYYNRHTGESSWTKPLILKNEELEEVDHYGPHDRVQCLRGMSSEWRLEQGFWYNNIEWAQEMPQCLVKLQQAISERNELMGDEWEEILDEDSGLYFYYNNKTEQVQWRPPPNVVIKKCEADEIVESDDDDEPPEALEVSKDGKIYDSDCFSEDDEKKHLMLLKKSRKCHWVDLTGFMLDEMLIDKMLSCTSVRMGYNRLRHIPPSIKTLQNLIHLSVNNNELEDLPVELWYCVRLKELDVRSNCIKELPRDKGNMEALREINVWDLGIETMQELGSLRLDRNSFTQVDVESLEGLEILTAGDNQLTTYPKIGPKVTTLDVSCNEIAHGTLASKNLLYVNLSYNLLDTLPVFSVIKVLNISDNKLISIPFLPDTLQVLHAARNELSEMPPNLNLKILDVSGNKLKTIVVTAMHVNVSHNELVSIKVAAKTLDASYNELTTGPSGIKYRLNLSHNRIKNMPDELPPIVDLSHNQITDFELNDPLEILNISGNALEKLPSSLFSEHLRELDCSYNHLLTIPDEVGSAKHLAKLDLCHNRLQSVPETLSNCTELTSLSATHNQLRQRIQINTLQHISLDMNPINYLYSRQQLVNEANHLFVTGDYPQAIEMYTAIYDDCKDVSVLPRRGLALLALEEFEKAAFDLVDDVYLGVAQFATDPALALLSFNRALKTNSDISLAYKYRGACRNALGDYSGAIDDCTIFLGNYNMFDGEVHYNMGLAWERLGNIDSSLQSYQQALESRCSGLAHYRMGLVQRDLGMNAVAVQEFQDAYDELYGQWDKEKQSARKKYLGEILYLSLVCKSSVLQTMKKDKKAEIAYRQALKLKLSL